MKKIFICLAVLLTAGIALNKNTYADSCVETLPNMLRACFGANQINTLDVTVTGSTCTISGTVMSGQLTDANNCVKSYEEGAAFCPGAPTLLFTAVITDGAPAPRKKSNA